MENRNKKSKKGPALSALEGFTIIELIVVIAIIAVLAGIVLVNVTQYMAKARNAKRLSDITSYVKALTIYYTDHSEYPDADGAQNYCCLGSDTNNCWDGAYSPCVNANNALKDSLPGLPNGAPVRTSTGSNLNGYLWHFSNRYLLWAMEGENQSCGMGVVNDADFFGATTCTYTFSQ